MARNSQRPTPAIRRANTEKDLEVEVIQTYFSDVSSVRGWGDSGRKIQLVEHECPNDYCQFDRMLRVVGVNPEFGTSYDYYCLSPNCGHYHDGEFNWATSAPKATKPAVNDVE